MTGMNTGRGGSGMSGMKASPEMFAAGDLIRVTGTPPGPMPEDTSRLFARLVGRTLRVDEVAEWGDLALNVLDDGSQSPDWNSHTLWLPPSCAEIAITETRDPTPHTQSRS